LVGQLEEQNGFKYLFTMMDWYMRWHEAIPIQNKETETIVETFTQEWISQYGVPEIVTSDQGKEFTLGVFRRLAQEFGIKHV